MLAKLVSGVRGEWSFLPDAPARRSGGPSRCLAAAGSSPGRSSRSGPRYMRAALARLVTVVQDIPGVIMQQ
nr:hypothetical protein [Kibdelosporangium sp. MJ126-NF4]CEL17608.1 hypothetical protein [Kibdelosporangium sp. MJ126-NF4]CTQ91165.1 hypothetical protein [Kibdelosporangium sp. MJ126-NF4]